MSGKLIKYDNINYVMPFLFCNDLFIPVLDKLFENEKNPVKYVYGNVICAWAGGRPTLIKISNVENIVSYIEKIKKYNITPTFTFSNQSLTKEKLNDKFCNDLLDIAYSYNCHFIVATDLLYNHIKSRYKDAHMVCSVIMPHLKYIKDVDRIEVLINQKCHYNCKIAKQHYILNEQFDDGILTFEEYSKAVSAICPKFKPAYNSVYMSEEMVDILIQQGIKLFKLQGRNYPFDFLLDDLYKFLFNKEISKEKIYAKINNICSNIIQTNKMAQLNLV